MKMKPSFEAKRNQPGRESHRILQAGHLAEAASVTARPLPKTVASEPAALFVAKRDNDAGCISSGVASALLTRPVNARSSSGATLRAFGHFDHVGAHGMMSQSDLAMRVAREPDVVDKISRFLDKEETSVGVINLMMLMNGIPLLPFVNRHDVIPTTFLTAVGLQGLHIGLAILAERHVGSKIDLDELQPILDAASKADPTTDAFVLCKLNAKYSHHMTEEAQDALDRQLEVLEEMDPQNVRDVENVLAILIETEMALDKDAVSGFDASVLNWASDRAVQLVAPALVEKLQAAGVTLVDTQENPKPPHFVEDATKKLVKLLDINTERAQMILDHASTAAGVSELSDILAGGVGRLAEQSTPIDIDRVKAALAHIDPSSLEKVKMVAVRRLMDDKGVPSKPLKFASLADADAFLKSLDVDAERRLSYLVYHTKLDRNELAQNADVVVGLLEQAKKGGNGARALKMAWEGHNGIGRRRQPDAPEHIESVEEFAAWRAQVDVIDRAMEKVVI